jgi:hypothetical protein
MPIPLYHADKCYVVSETLAKILQDAGWSRQPIIRTAKPIWTTPEFEKTLAKIWTNKVIQKDEPESILLIRRMFEAESDKYVTYTKELEAISGIVSEDTGAFKDSDLIKVIDKIEKNPLPKMESNPKESKNGKRKTSRR